MRGIPHAEHEADLAVYYDRQAPVRNTRALTPHRVKCREWFVRLLKSEHRHSLFELGCGTGVEGLEFVRTGLHYTGVDLSSESVHLARSAGLEATVASGRSLPFKDDVFSAAWTMSTLLHVPNSGIHDVVSELVRVTAPGAPIAVGLWSGEDCEVLNPEDLEEPRRFFSRRSDDTVLRIFGEHGSVEHFRTWPEGVGVESGPGAGNWAQHYQFLVLRTPAPNYAGRMAPSYTFAGDTPAIHETAFVAPTASIIGKATLAQDSSAFYGVSVRADTAAISVGAGSNLQDNVVLHADPGFPCTVGERVSVGHSAVVHGCTVEDDCLIGMSATILNGAVIGRGSLIAAGAVVLEGTVIPPRSLVAGVPAKVRRELTDEEFEGVKHNAAHYKELAAAHREMHA